MRTATHHEKQFQKIEIVGKTLKENIGLKGLMMDMKTKVRAIKELYIGIPPPHLHSIYVFYQTTGENILYYLS